MRRERSDRKSRLNRSDRSAASLDGQESLRQKMRAMGLKVDDIAAELSRTYKLRPREAYRVASGLTLQEAVDRFNVYAARTEPPIKTTLSVDELRDYEGAPDGGSVPSLATLDLLAQVYETDARNLVDFQDRVHMLPRERASLDKEAHAGSRSGQSISALLIAQATAALALAFAVIYAAGDLQLGFKIWYIQDTWAPVLGGMPQELVLVNAISDLIPALVAAIPIYYVYQRCYDPNRGRGSDYRLRRQFSVMLISAAVLSLITGLSLHFTARYFYPDVLRPWLDVVIACFVINIVVVGSALAVLWLVDIHNRSNPLARRVLGLGVTAIALVPCVASVYAAFPLPQVVLCGPGFYYQDQNGRHYMIGNLIGNAGQLVYVAETRTSMTAKYGLYASGHYISVVPLSEVEDETVGSSAECHNLVQVPASVQPARSRSATPTASATRKP